MQTHVYANGLEIACKAAGRDGYSPAAFPDACWSPPPPKPGPILIPYPNTCYAGDITNGSTTVFICGEQVALEDLSYFSTSTGNEPATSAFQKGDKTGVIQGKAYFQQWSMDVVFEGKGVPRHQDSVSHNHGSMPSNTALFPYLSRGWFGNECSKEEKAIERACEKESKQSDARKDVKSKSKVSALFKAKRNGKSGVGRRDKDGHHWTDDHCDGLHMSLHTPDEALKYAKEMEEVYKNLPGELDLMGAMRSELESMVVNAGAKAGGKWLAKTAAKEAVGSSVPVVGNVLMGIWSAVDGVMTINSVAEIREVATEALEQLKTLESSMGQLKSLSKEFENFSQLSPEEQLEKARKLDAEGQDLLATLNACTRARKCNLVPYDANGIGNAIGKRDPKNPSRVESSTKGGCCKGQTGHHLIYGAMAKDACPSGPGYDHNAAPTVCTEGTSQYLGSHGRVHDAMDKQVKGLAEAGKLQGGTMSLDQAIDAAAKSHQQAFPFSRCSKKCIEAQLKSYYGGACKTGRFKAVNKSGTPVKPDVADR